MNVTVTASVHRDTVVTALKRLTIENDQFDPDQWALLDGEDLIRAGCMITREIVTQRPTLRGLGESTCQSVRTLLIELQQIDPVFVKSLVPLLEKSSS